MHAFVRRALQTALVTGGLVAVGAGAASASEGLLGDLGIDVPIDVSIDVSNLGLAVLGESTVVSNEESMVTSPAPAAPVAPDQPGDGGGSLIGDIGISVPVTVPVEVSNLGLAVLGESSVVSTEESMVASPAPAAPVAPVQPSDGGGSLIGDIGISVPVTVPVGVSNIGVAVLGESTVVSNEESTVTSPAPAAPAAPVQPGDGGGSLIGKIGIDIPVTIPVNVGCLGLGILGDVSVSCTTTTITTPTDPTDPTGPTGPTDPSTPTTPTDRIHPPVVVVTDAVTPTTHDSVTFRSAHNAHNVAATYSAASESLPVTGTSPFLGAFALLLLAIGVTMLKTRRTDRTLT